MPQEAMLMKEVWVPAERPFVFREAQDPRTGEQKFIMTGLILPFGKISRNNVLYNKESIYEKYKQLLGRPVMYNHQIEGNNLPRGHFVDSYCIENADESHPMPGWYYRADIDPAETDLIRKLRREDLRHVSIQLVGGKVLERIDAESGRAYSEAYVADIIEGSIVPAPGFLDTTAQFAESLREQAGPIIPDTSQDGKSVKLRNESQSCTATQQRQEEGKMPKLKENEATQDSQATANVAGATGKGTPLDPQTVGQNAGSGMIAKEAEVGGDSQAGAAIPPDKDKGTPLMPKGAGQDEPYEKRIEPAAKMEKARYTKAGRFKSKLMKEAEEEEEEAFHKLREARKKLQEAEEEEEGKEEEKEEEEKLREKKKLREEEEEEEEEKASKKKRFKEEEEEEEEEKLREFREQYEDDMGKMTDIVERLKEELDSLKDQVAKLGTPAAKEGGEEEKGEPQPPMTESAKMNSIFVETVKGDNKEKEFTEATRKVLYG